MGNNGWDGRNRRSGDRILKWARLESIILIGLVPVAAMLFDVFMGWKLTAEWVTMYCVGVVGGAATLFGLARKNGKP